MTMSATTGETAIRIRRRRAARAPLAAAIARCAASRFWAAVGVDARDDGALVTTGCLRLVVTSDRQPDVARPRRAGQRAAYLKSRVPVVFSSRHRLTRTPNRRRSSSLGTKSSVETTTFTVGRHGLRGQWWPIGRPTGPRTPVADCPNLPARPDGAPGDGPLNSYIAELVRLSATQDPPDPHGLTKRILAHLAAAGLYPSPGEPAR